MKRTDLIQQNDKTTDDTEGRNYFWHDIVFTFSQECQTKGQSQYHSQIYLLSDGKYDFGERIFLSRIFLGYALYAGRIWKGVIMVASLEELETWARRKSMLEGSTRKKWWPKSGDNFMFPVEEGRVKLLGRDQVLRTFTWLQEHFERVVFPRRSWRLRRVSIIWLISGWQCSPGMTSVGFKELHWRHHVEPGVQLNVPKEKSFLITKHWCDQGYTHSFRCLTGKPCWWGSRSARSIDKIYTVHNIEWETSRRVHMVWRLTGRQHQGQIICGQKFGQKCQRQLNGKKSKNGRAKNRSLTIQGCCEAFILPMWKVRDSWKPWRIARKKKYLWKHLCRARSEVVSARKSAVNHTSTDACIHVLWRPRSLPESVRKNSTQRSRR